MKNITKQKRKRKTTPSINERGRLIGRTGWGQTNKMISTLR